MKKLSDLALSVFHKVWDLPLGIAIVIGAVAFGGFFYYSRAGGGYSEIAVTGYASKEVVSDEVIWEINFSHKGKTMKESMDLVKKDEKVVRAFLADADIGQDFISDTGYDTDPTYKKNNQGYSTNQIDGYKTYAMIRVDHSDVWLIDDLYSQINNLVLKGISLGSVFPKYYYSGLEELKLELLDDAAENARMRADIIAEGGGVSITRLDYASQGVFQINAVGDKSVSGYGNFDTSSIRKEVTAVINARFVAR